VRKEQNVAVFSAKPSPAGGLIELQAAALEATANAVVITDQTGTVIWVNSAFEKLTGYTPTEIVGQSTRVLKSGQNARVVYEEMWRTILRGNVWRGELINRRKDGSLYDEEMTITPVRNAGGEVTHYIAIKLDVTERKKSDDHQYRLTQAIESSSELVVMTNSDGVFAFANRAFLDTLGYSKKELVGKHFSFLMSANNPRELLEKFDQKRVEPGGWKGECLLVRQAGSDLLVSLNVGPVMDEAGRVVGTFGISEDISERKRMEDNLRRLAEIVESSDDAIISKTLDGIILTWNSGAERMYRYSAAEAIGQPISFLYPNSQANEIPKILEKVKRDQVVRNFETIRAVKGGKEIHISLTLSPLKDTSGRIVGASAVGRDMTESKQMEEMFRQAQKMEAVGRLASGVAHDFNNMLSVILGYSEMLLERADPDSSISNACEEIKKAGNRAVLLTRQLLAFSRQQQLEPRFLNLNTSVVEIEKMIRRLIGEDIDLRISLNTSLGIVKADPGQIDQIIMNLAVNARDAMPEGGKLIIETSNAEFDEEYALHHPPCISGRYVGLTVTDTGIGMSRETIAHIFEPFFTTKEVGKGTGLGLSTVYGVVKQSNGYIWVYSEPGQGSVFRIYLPQVVESADQIRPDESPTEPLRGTETVLLVEDEPSVRTLTRIMLEQNGYTVLEAENGANAIAIAKEHQGHIHLLLTDVLMPKMNGPEVSEKVHWIHAEAKTLYVSGYCGTFGTCDLLPEGSHRLQKPVVRRTLLRKLRSLLDVRKESEPK
jgi:two-component system, cell cycle sensor histidine kinase and response regulator CckA